jgi:hypothetical protein
MIAKVLPDGAKAQLDGAVDQLNEASNGLYEDKGRLDRVGD